MSRLAKFQRKPLEKEIKLPDGTVEKFLFKPFKTTDISLMMDLAKPEKAAESAKAIIKKVVKENIPDSTDEEFDQMDYVFADQILEGAMESNDVDIEDAKQKFLNDLKAKQQAAFTPKPKA